MIEIPTLVDRPTFNNIFNMISARIAERYNQPDGKTNVKNLVEVGSFLGGSACYLAQKIKEDGGRANLFCVDTWDFNNIGPDHIRMVDGNKSNYSNFIDNVNRCDVADMITPIESDSITAASEFDDGNIDFLYLDGCHDREYVYKELEAWYPKMNENSFISGHDFNDVGVRDSVERFFAERQHSIVQHGESYLVQLGRGI